MIDIDRAALTRALADWRQILGDEYVSSHPDELRSAGTATFRTRAQVAAVLRPGTREEVQRCVEVANARRVPLYPVSSGKNWGYGSRVPVEDAVLLDLGRLNRILDFDEQLAYVTVEPGVTQRQLYEFLRARGSNLWMDATGASPDCSLIGNTLERGFGHTPIGDHCGQVCGFEVVLPTGECIETGFSRLHQSPMGALSRWGVGPSIDGLFSQSNLGIVTRMSVWLMPAPEYFQAFFFQTKDEQGLPAIVDALRPLRLNGTLRSVVHIGNDYKVLSGTGQYPWDVTGGATPLDADTMRELRAKFGIGSWSGSGGLYGTRRQVREARALVKRALRGKVDRLQFVDDRLLALLPWLAKPFRVFTGHDLNRTVKLLVPVYNLMKGVPTESSLGSAYWRKRGAVPNDPDPDRDRCGLLWCSPVAPNTGEHAAAVNDLASRVMLAHGFEPIISVSLMNERTLVSIIAITYDRDVEGEDGRALECHRQLSRQLVERGYPPYRLNLASMGLLSAPDSYTELLGTLKEAIDPNGVLAPGRYQPAARQAIRTAIAG